MENQAAINVIQKIDSPIHEWYRFVQSFPPHLVRRYIEQFQLGRKDLLFDPFCGTGTTLVEAKKCAIGSVGCDAHPFAVLVSRVKTNWSLDVQCLSSLLSRIVVVADRRMLRHGFRTLSLFRTSGLESGSEQKNEYRLTEDEEKLLPTGFLSKRPLQRLLILRDVVEERTKNHPAEIREFFLVAIAHVIAKGAGNFAFGPEIYRTRAKPDYDVLSHFENQAKRMLSEMRLAQSTSTHSVRAEAFFDDARFLNQIPSGLSGVITSPPYPNEKDYTRTTRVESILLGILRNRQQLRSVKESLLRSNTRNVFVMDNDGDEVAKFKSIQAVCRKIERRRVELGKTSGFEKLYPKVVAHYFGGMRRHFRSLRPQLAPKAHLAYVVGDQLSFLMIPIATAELLGEVAKAEGFKVVGREFWRERVGTKIRNSRTNQRTVRAREEILILQN